MPAPGNRWLVRWNLRRAMLQSAEAETHVNDRIVRRDLGLPVETVVTEELIRRWATEERNGRDYVNSWHNVDELDESSEVDVTITPVPVAPPPPPAPPPDEPPIYGEVIPVVPVNGPAYRHPENCSCQVCECNTEWSKTPPVTVRTNKKKGIFTAADWHIGRTNSVATEENEG